MAMPALHTAVGISVFAWLKSILPLPIILPIVALTHIPLDLYPEYYKLDKKTNEGELFSYAGQTLLMIFVMLWGIKIFGLLNYFLVFGASLLFDVVDGVYCFFKKKNLFFFHGNGTWPIGKDIKWQTARLLPIHNLGLDCIIILSMCMLWY